MDLLYSTLFLCVVCTHSQAAELPKPTISPSTSPILEYTRVTLSCLVKIIPVSVNTSIPEISFSWFVGGKRVTADVTRNVYSPTFSRKQHGSVITCSVSDDTGGVSPTSSPYRLNIEYKPGKPVFNPHNDVYVLNNNCNNAVGPVVCSDDCRPSCTYEWRVDDVRIKGARFPVTILRSLGRNQTKLSCHASNKHGSFTRNIAVKFVPDPPRSFFCIDHSEDSVLLSGTSNKTLQFQVSSTITNRSFSDVSQTSLTLVRNADTFHVNVTGLSAGVNFLFRVYAVNPSGRSDPTFTVCATRADTVHSTGTGEDGGLGFAAGVGIGVFILLVIVILLLLVALLIFKTTAAGRRKATDLKTHYFPPSENRHYDVCRERDGTERKGPEGIETQDSTLPGTHYESLGVTEPQTPTTYEKLKLYENQRFGKTDNIYVNDVVLNAME